MSQFRAPPTASGVTFVTLEDETDTINVVWRATAEKCRRELLGSTLLTVYGHAERVETSAAPAMHLIASRPTDKRRLLRDLTAAGRDSQRLRASRYIAAPTRGQPLTVDSRSAILRWPATFFDRRLAHAILALPAGFCASFAQQT